MDDFEGLADLEAVAKNRRYCWVEVVDFSTSIAGSAVGQAKTQLENGWAMRVDAMALSIWVPSAAQTNVPAFTPAAERAGNGSGADVNDWTTYDAFRLEVWTNSQPWFAGPVRASLIAGNGRNPYYLRAPRWIIPGGTIVAKLYNDGAETVQAQLALDGVREAVAANWKPR